MQLQKYEHHSQIVYEPLREQTNAYFSKQNDEQAILSLNQIKVELIETKTPNFREPSIDCFELISIPEIISFLSLIVFDIIAYNYFRDPIEQKVQLCKELFSFNRQHVEYLDFPCYQYVRWNETPFPKLICVITGCFFSIIAMRRITCLSISYFKRQSIRNKNESIKQRSQDILKHYGLKDLNSLIKNKQIRILD